MTEQAMPYTADIGEAGEIDLLVWFDYQPEERQTYWEPGCSADAKVNRITLADGSEIPEILKGLKKTLLSDEKECVRTMCIEWMHEKIQEDRDDARISAYTYDR